jgi:nuclease-like protein
MQIIENERRIKISTNIGRILPWIGLGILAVGWVLSLRGPEALPALLLSLPVGVLISMVGGYFADQFAGPLAHHEALQKALKGLDQKYASVHYLLPAPHVLLSPGGCTVIVVKGHAGVVEFDGERWKHRDRGKFFRQLAGQSGLGNPTMETERQTQRLQAWLDEQLPGREIPIQTAILFVHPRVKLNTDDSPVPAFYGGKKIRAWLRGPGKQTRLKAEDHQALMDAVENLV